MPEGRAQRLGDLPAGEGLGLGRHGVFQLQDQRVGVERAGLFQRAGVGARHVERGAAGPDGRSGIFNHAQRMLAIG